MRLVNVGSAVICMIVCYAYMHDYIHDTHKYIHTYTRTCMHAYTHIRMHAHTYVHTHMYSLFRILLLHMLFPTQKCFDMNVLYTMIYVTDFVKINHVRAPVKIDFLV